MYYRLKYQYIYHHSPHGSMSLFCSDWEFYGVYLLIVISHQWFHRLALSLTYSIYFVLPLYYVIPWYFIFVHQKIIFLLRLSLLDIPRNTRKPWALQGPGQSVPGSSSAAQVSSLSPTSLLHSQRLIPLPLPLSLSLCLSLSPSLFEAEALLCLFLEGEKH